MTSPRFLAVGHLTHDRYGDQIAPGGSVGYAAGVMKELGATVAIATAVGDDYAFRSNLKNIDVFMTKSRTTTVFENTYPEGAARLMLVEHPAADVETTSVPAEWHRPDVLFLAPVVGEISLGTWLNGPIHADIVGLGLQGFLKQQGATYKEGPGSLLAPRHFNPSDALLQKMTAVFLSEEDLQGFADMALLNRLKRHVPVVAVTDGDNGATIYTKEETLHIGVRQTTAVDPTGAGDTFAVGVLYGLATQASVVDAARLGAAAASIIVEGVGQSTLHNVGKAASIAADIPISKI